MIMPRASKEDAAQHRQDIIIAAARLFRERGLDGVSVPELMEAVGLTHGGFYRHFASKDELVSLALDESFDQAKRLGEKTLADQDDDAAAARRAYIDAYLSPSHRANRGASCPNAALCGDIGRTERKNPLHRSYARNLDESLTQLAEMMPDKDSGKARQSAIAMLSTLVGALVMARASQGDPLSDEILTAAKATLLTDPPKRRAS
jgi:TetR/AcrR family transcriptional repressor of nem operon